MILKISLRAKVGVPKTLVKRKFRQHSLYFPHNTLMLTESCGEFSDLLSIFRLRAFRYSVCHHSYYYRLNWTPFSPITLLIERLLSRARAKAFKIASHDSPSVTTSLSRNRLSKRKNCLRNRR